MQRRLSFVPRFARWVQLGRGESLTRLASKRAYSGYDRDRALESGMVVSIETTMKHPRRGFIKLEDTVAVTETGFEAFGDTGRGWNRAGKPA